MRLWLLATAISIALGGLGACACLAQASAPSTTPHASPDASPHASPHASPAPAETASTPPAAEPSSSASAPSSAAPALPTYTVPAGTKILLQLQSALNTRSARPGDGVYLSSTFPVVVGDRVMIPVGVYVQGVVDRVRRAGHLHGRAQLDMHFTSIIFPNGTVAEVPGVVDALPGASNQKVKGNGEGTIEQNGDKTRNLGTAAEVAIPTGGTVGSVAGLGSGHPLAGGLAGAGAGLAAAGLVSLFTRGADVNIPAGTQVEMVLQRPLILQAENLAPAGSSIAPAPLMPSPNQPKPITKHGRLLCPFGSLGCD